jgi:hypothetical protein
MESRDSVRHRSPCANCGAKEGGIQLEDLDGNSVELLEPTH